MIAVQSTLSRNTFMTTLTYEGFAVTRGGKGQWDVSEQVRIDASVSISEVVGTPKNSGV